MSKLETRLKRQLASRGVKGAKGMAAALLKKRGHMADDGTLTEEGKRRQAMGNAGRAKDRAAKKSGRKPSEYRYDPKTNQAKVKKDAP